MQADAAFLATRALWAGQHVLPLFFATLALLLAAVCGLWWAVERCTVSRTQSDMPATPSIRLRIALGMAAILVGAGVFAALAGQLAAGGELARADQALTDALRAGVPPLALRAFAVLTRLGDTATLTMLCIVVAIALVALGRRGLAAGWVFAVAGNSLLNPTLKQMFGRVRPLQTDGVELVQGFSFPSGHSSGSVVAYGMLAYLALRLLPSRWHLLTLVVAVSLAFTVGASRMFLRVHFASDVIAGLASGTAWLALCVTSTEIARWWRQRNA